ncbi:hypothetical protein Ancab_001790, partial [Ancistrocladus abbreviatus]
KNGKKFGFIRFVNVNNLDKLITDLNQVWIGSYKIFANLAKYNQEGSGTLKQQRSSIFTRTKGSSPKKNFAEAVRGTLYVGEWVGHPMDLYDTCWENQGSNVMEIRALDSDIKWLEKCFVGEMHYEDNVPGFIKMINKEGR